MKDQVFSYGEARNGAEKACLHVLQRIQHDANVYYLLGLGTESFALLCAAEAEMTGEDVEAVKRRRVQCLDARESEVDRLRARVAELEGAQPEQDATPATPADVQLLGAREASLRAWREKRDAVSVLTPDDSYRAGWDDGWEQAHELAELSIRELSDELEHERQGSDDGKGKP